MKTIAVAGGTGNLGGRVLRELGARKATIVALARPDTDPVKLAKIEDMGARVEVVDLRDVNAVAQAVDGAHCFLSTLAGLADVIIDTQTQLLQACVEAGVPRFVPSDFSADINALPAGHNRNFDLRLEFQERLANSSIQSTSVFNGCFAEVLAYGGPLLDPGTHTAGFWDDADWTMEFTTMDDVAKYTAEVVLDDDTPRALHIASFQASPRQLTACASEVAKTPYTLKHMGSRAALDAHNQAQRKAHPEGEKELYPRWQQGQYMWSMTGAHSQRLDNARYPKLRWASMQDVLRRTLTVSAQR